MLEGLGNFAWWIVGLTLLVLEMAVPGVYFLFLGIAALVVGTNVLILGSSGWFGWQQQIIAFVAVSVATVLVGRRWYGAKTDGGSTGSLNTGAERLIGRSAVVSDALAGGRGRVAIDDGWWTVEGPDLPAGTRVRIVAAKGSMLVVAPAEP